MNTGELQLEFRLAKLEDAEQVRQLVESAFRASDSRPEWTADMDLHLSFTLDLADIVAHIKKPQGAVLIATDPAGNWVASVNVNMRTAELARISMLAVVAEHQRGGMGRRVLEYAEGYCRTRWGAQKAGLNALATRKRLIEWYKRRGYRETGETTPFPYDLVEGVEVSDELYFVEMEKGLGEL